MNKTCFRAPQYRTILFWVWSAVFLWIVASSWHDIKGGYLLLILSTFPLSIFTQSLPRGAFELLSYLGGLIVWVWVIGGLLDRFVPPMTIWPSQKLLHDVSITAFMLALLGFVASLLTLSSSFWSTITYNAAIALIITGIGLELFCRHSSSETSRIGRGFFYLFFLSMLGFLVSLLTLGVPDTSQLLYNVSLALSVVAVGGKMLFVATDQKNG